MVKHNTQDEIKDTKAETNGDGHEEKVKELQEKYLRALADYQNLEKREKLERGQAIKRGIADFIRDLLRVLDPLEKAGQHLADPGLNLVIKEFQDVLASHGLERIVTLNRKFDPTEMECVAVVESEEEGEVLEETRPGYKMGDMIIQVAQVKVGKKKVDQREEELTKEQLQKGGYM